jgi:hypothetical protein
VGSRAANDEAINSVNSLPIAHWPPGRGLAGYDCSSSDPWRGLAVFIS